MFQRCFSHSESELSLVPLPVAIFTLITTIQNRQIGEHGQRQNVFISYINDISHLNGFKKNYFW
jgi:hypothetical protein